ncbi:MAG: cation-translocating P-type ATPase [Nitrospinota bacterium]|jgi:heavy metal translocating P-type ATPase|nr:cation-translocating P-type ATPase [Nitrospinota bacterium]MDP7386273.1 cation-translocating P-type ATPase [Nitrospinota bacterium]HJM43804.1 cation-translocating P-type ATPase [Nitrospinota bacterium]
MTTETERKPLEKLNLKIGGMQCSFCVDSVHKALARVKGGGGVAVSLSHEEALVRYDPEEAAPAEIENTLTSMGYTVRDPRKVFSFEEEEAEVRRHRNLLAGTAVFLAASLGLMTPMWLGVRQPWFKWAMLALALGMVFGVGRPILKMAWAALRRGILNQHVLMEFGAFAGLAGGAVGFFKSPWPTGDFLGAAVFITAYHVFSMYVSTAVRTKSSRAIRKLMDLRPATARVLRDGREEETPVEEVRPGDLVRIRPGEGVPVDGVIVEGHSGVDNSLVTGESIPVERTVGDEVIGGSVNQTGTLLVRVAKVGEENFLQRVARSIQEARALKPGVLQLVERVLKWFVPGVLIAAGTAFTLWTFGSWLVIGQPDFGRGVFAALATLVMGYPCALGMATPLAMIRGGGIAADKGVLMRSGEAFQVFKDVRKVVLDKTGTLTRGRPRVVEVAAAEGFTEERLLPLAAESRSEHPLARAVVERAEETGLPEARDFEALPGRGIKATVEDRQVRVGSLRFLAEEGVDLASLRARVEEMEGRGQTVVGVAEDGRATGVLAIADTLKDDAIETVARMKAAGLAPVMITGDNRRTANAVAAQVGISEVLAEVLPDQKAEKVRELQGQSHRVAMVGDGINDAPALMQADVGIAVGAGTDIAIESADVVLMGDRLGGVMDAYAIGKGSFRKTFQNVVLAFAFNGVGRVFRLR